MLFILDFYFLQIEKAIKANLFSDYIFFFNFLKSDSILFHLDYIFCYCFIYRFDTLINR